MRILMICTMVFCFGLLKAQKTETTSQIKGKVVTQDVSVLPGATVIVKNTDESIEKQAIVNEEGFFAISDLPIDHRYICTVSHKDYQDVVLKNFTLVEGKLLNIDFKMYKEANDEIGIDNIAYLNE